MGYPVNLPVPWTRQPQIAVPARPDLSPLFVVNGAFRADLARGSAPDFSSDFVSTVIGNGKTLSNSGFKSPIVSNSDLVLGTGSAVTILFQGKKSVNAAGAGTFGLNQTSASAGSTGNFNLYVPFPGDGNVYFRWGGTTDGVTSVQASSLAFSAEDWWAFTTGPRGMEIWQNGRLVASNSATPSRTTTSSVGLLWGAAFSNDTTSMGADASLFATFSKQLPQSLLKQKSYWEIFTPQPRRIWVGAASGSPYTLTAEAGSIVLTGQNVSLTAARKITAEAGSIAITGRDVALTAARKITAEAGAIALTGIDAGLLAARKITAEAGAHTLTGIDVGLTAARKLLADTGAIVLTGQDVALIYTAAGAYTLAAGAGSFALTGQDAGLTAARRIALDAGAFTLTGVDVGLVYAATGSYTLTAAAGQFVLTGQNVTLDYFSVVRAARARATGSITESNQRPTAAAPGRPSRRS